MKTLEQLIIDKFKQGKFNLTVWHLVNGKFQASFSRDKVAWNIQQADDPACAIRLVLTDLLPEKPKKKNDDFEDLLG